MRWLVGMLTALFLMLVSGVATAASFDCKKSSTSIELAICRDEQLNSADETMALIYSKLLNSLQYVDKLKLVEEQRKWLRQRNRECAKPSTQCLSPVYRRRIGDLLNRSDQLVSFDADDLDRIAKEFPVHPDWVGVYLVRNQDRGDVDIPVTVDLNSKIVGQTVPKSFFWFRLKPSSNRYWFGSFSVHTNAMALSVPSGRNWYFVYLESIPEERNGVVVIDSTFRSVRDEVGMNKVLGAQLVVASEVGRNLVPPEDPRTYNKPCDQDSQRKLEEISSMFKQGTITQSGWSREHKAVLERCERD